jgi:hypothetical protein
MTEETASAASTLIDNLNAPVVFSTDATGFSRLGGNIAVTFESWVADHQNPPGAPKRVVVGRLVMPNEAAQRLALGLHDYLTKVGLDPTATLKGEAPVQ